MRSRTALNARGTRSPFGASLPAAGLKSDGRLAPNRAPFEYYPTPPEATRALLASEQFDGSIWEPACGDGAISGVLEAAGYRVISTDLIDYGYGAAGIDFLKETRPRAKHNVNNPPYGNGLADRFLRHALTLCEETGGSVAMLLNLVSLCHPSRHDSFIRKPPSVIYALDECICWPCGDPTQATRFTRQHRYCWMVWHPGHEGETIFRWLSTAPYRT